ncbi:beta-propeller domain-containing protein [Pontibacillus sp. ALD_SL1]|uniref:beta-propeller domain-containing protein n=1 Tax=Pontibacillus sp. ALD_SL1 TaxID=2777185 RepID=UPI001A965923|nr:beta-propeller domain-containing protein [Pontibacillus sp. ALD_SL1]QST00789.1 beta-propeller domain-containing protein [Pontibacillus sp. ALD_SL1]
MKRMVITGIALVVSLFIILYGVANWGVSAEVKEESEVVPIHKDWTIVFSKEMNKESFTDETIRVINKKTGEKVPTTFEISGNGESLNIFAPKDGYEVNQDYTLTISKGVTSVRDVELSKDFTYTFTTSKELPTIGSEEELKAILKKFQNERSSMQFETVEESADVSASSEDSASSSSETNVQVNGVDEADLVKNDGEHIYYARNDDIVIAKGSPIEEAKVLSKINDEDFIPNQLFLYNDRLVVLGHQQQSLPRDPKEEASAAESMIMPNFRSHMAVRVYDVSDPASPEKMRDLNVEGNYLTSRMIDGQVYVLSNEYTSIHRLEEKKQNDQEVRPLFKDSAVSEDFQPIPYGKMHQLPGSKDSSFLTIASFDVTDDGTPANVKTYLGAGDTVYMSKDHLYVATHSRNFRVEPFFATSSFPEDLEQSTRIYQFNVKNGDLIYNGEADVPGHLINQFAMDERDDSFRVATTTGQFWGDENPSFNNLYTFDLSMTPIGKVEGLAKGERIYSVRFMQDRAYMVTFKQVDPLFVIDLKEPSSPEVLGELKIPGFSDYLHPLGEDHLIGIGQDTEIVKSDGRERVVTKGVKLSLFDVSDVSNPVEKDVAIIGGKGSYTDVSHDHKALYIHPEENLFGLPVQVSEEYERKAQGAYLYKITPENGFELQTTITNEDGDRPHVRYESRITRLISINDTLFTLSHNELKGVDLNTMEEVKTISWRKQQENE